MPTPSGPAGGDLAGFYPNPSVATCPDAALSANIPIMTAGVLPAVDGSQLTNLPVAPGPRWLSGNLDGSGTLDLSGIGILPSGAVASFQGATGTGILYYDGGVNAIVSTAGPVDAGIRVTAIAVP